MVLGQYQGLPSTSILDRIPRSCIISVAEIVPNPTKVKAAHDFPVPISMLEV